MPLRVDTYPVHDRLVCGNPTCGKMANLTYRSIHPHGTIVTAACDYCGIFYTLGLWDQYGRWMSPGFNQSDLRDN